MRLRIAIIASLCGAAALAATGQTESNCGVCHPESRVQFSVSVHAHEGVTCVDCHGGDSSSREVEAAHGGRFRDLSDRRQLPASCAECHADLAQMRPYNLPVDQYAIYQTSQHGLALAAGDTRVAVCTDCHGVHEIRRADDPGSSVYSRNVADTCGVCHGDSALMAEYGIDGDVVADYRTGRHGVALLDEGQTAAPACNDCHGAHGATPPGVGDVDKVCGSCHADTREAFLEGPHHQALREAGLAECAACHSNHGVQRPTSAEVALTCSECHDDSSEQVALGQRMQELIDGATEEVRRAELLVAEAERGPHHVEDYLSRIEQAHTYLTEVAPVVHSVSLEPVEAVTRRARSVGEEVRLELEEKLDRTTAYALLALVWFYLLMTLAILLIYRRRLRREAQAA